MHGVDVAMTGQMQGFERAIQVEPLAEILRAAALFDNQLQGQTLGGVENRRFFGFEIQRLHTFRRGGHEYQSQVAMAGGDRRALGTDPAGHLEELHCVVGQVAIGARQQLPGRLEQRLRQRVAQLVDADFQGARTARPGPGRRPAILVEPVEEFASDRQQFVIAVVAHCLVVALRPACQRRPALLTVATKLRRSRLCRAAQDIGPENLQNGVHHVLHQRVVVQEGRRGRRRSQGRIVPP